LKLKLAVKDIFDSFKGSDFWFTLAWQEVKQRYKRSAIGPFWITLSMGIMILAMGPLYGNLFKIDTSSYFKYLSISLIFWTFVSTCINEASTVFIASENYIKQIKLPFSGYVLKLMYKNIIYLIHNFVILLIVLCFYPIDTYSQFLFIPLTIAIVFFNLFFLSIIIGIVCLRFRDAPLIIASIMQIMFFISPILWKPESLGEKGLLIAKINPIYHLIEIMRSSIVGGIQENYYSYLYSIILLFFLFSASMILFSKFRSRIPYWF
jgi:ABC-type polysaccharide/polyol phosphate export permease